MDLDNLFEIVIHHPLIEGMTSFGHWTEFLMVSALSMYGYTLDKTYGESWLKLLGSHDFTKILHYIVSQP